MKNLLVVNVNWLGDVIFSLPVFKALKTAYPGCRVSCLAPLRVKEVLEMSQYVDEAIVFDERGSHRSLWAKIKVVRSLRDKKFDIAFLLHRSWTRALLIFLAGIPVMVGYDTKKRGCLLTHKFPSADKRIHRADQYLRVLESFGIKIEDRRSQIHIGDEMLVWADQFLRQRGISRNDRWIMLHCSGNWDLKRWPKEYFVQLITRLYREFSVKVVLPGSSEDSHFIQEIALQSGCNPVVLAGKTGIKELAALMKRSFVVISSDSGPLHLASAVGARVIGLFGPTRPEITGARGSEIFSILQKDVGCNREPCYYLECPNNVCMQSITVEDVVNEIKRIQKI